MANARLSVREVLKSLRRNLRDLILVVVGVLLALAADSWLDGRQDAHAELVMLRAMGASLTADLASLEQSMSDLRESEQAIGLLRERLESAAEYDPRIDALFGQAYYTGMVTQPNHAPYETIKSRGLQLIRDDSLREQIVHVYQTTYAQVDFANDLNLGVVLDVMRPYFLTNFANLQFGQSATPLNYSRLARDPYFDNLLAYRRDVIRRSILSSYEDAADRVRLLLEAVEHEIRPEG